MKNEDKRILDIRLEEKTNEVQLYLNIRKT